MVPDIGMNLISIRYDGKEILNQPKDADALRKSPCRYGNPLQLPANRTEAGVFTFEGKTYDLGINEPARNDYLLGIIRYSAFSDIQSGEDWVSGRLVNEGQYYPFPFVMEVRAEVDEEGCSERIELRNTGDSPMPIALGLHTVFILRDYFKVPLAKTREVNDCAIPTGRLLELNEEQKSFTDGTYKGGTLVDTFFTAAGTSAVVDGVRFTVSETFDSWIVWNADSKQGFIALEPQQGAPNCLNSGDGLIILQPGESEVFTTRFELDK